MSLSAAFSVFYSLYLTTLSFPKEVRRRHISQGPKKTAYLTVLFETCRDANEDKKVIASLSSQTQTQMGRDTFFQSLHHSPEKILGKLTVHAKQGTVCQSADGFSAHFYFAFGSYIENSPEKENILSSKRDKNISTQWHLCHVQKKWILCCVIWENKNYLANQKIADVCFVRK